MNQTFTIIGAGGHAKVVVATLLDLGTERLRIYDDDPEKWGTELLGVLVVGSIAEASAQAHHGAIVAIGDNRIRATLIAGLDLDWTSAVHPSAVVHPSASIGAGSVVCAGAIVQPGTRIGRHVIVNTSASVDHDCDIGDFAHIGPGARIAGGVQLGEGTLIGIGSAIVPNVAVGARVTVGAGAAVTRNLPEGCTAVGVPARILGAPR